MSRLAFLAVGVIVGASGMFVAMKYHVVRAEDGLHLIPRVGANFGDPYVDVRGFSVTDWNLRRELALAIVRADKGALLKDAAVDDMRKAMDDIMRTLGGQ